MSSIAWLRRNITNHLPRLPYDEERLLRIGRLIGVVLKEPFALEKDLVAPSPYSGAYRSWELEPATKFDDPSIQCSWQYQALEALRNALRRSRRNKHSWLAACECLRPRPDCTP